MQNSANSVRYQATSLSCPEARNSLLPKRAATSALLIVLMLSLGVSPWMTGLSEAACTRGAAACNDNTAGTMRTCSATLMCSAPPGTLTMAWQLVLYRSYNVTMCSPPFLTILGSTATFNLTAMASTAASNPRTCGWSWFTPAFSTNGRASISTADGLPVELMNFEIEDDPTSDTIGRTGSGEARIETPPKDIGK